VRVPLPEIDGKTLQLAFLEPILRVGDHLLAVVAGLDLLEAVLAVPATNELIRKVEVPACIVEKRQPRGGRVGEEVDKLEQARGWDGRPDIGRCVRCRLIEQHIHASDASIVRTAFSQADKLQAFIGMRRNRRGRHDERRR
jgi:hypothetical protein